MAHSETEKVVEKIIAILEQHGVSDYVLAFPDPDSPVDVLRLNGSPFWRMGLAIDMMEEVKFMRRSQWQREEEEAEESQST